MALLPLPYVGVSQSGHDLWRYVAPGMSDHFLVPHSLNSSLMEYSYILIYLSEYTTTSLCFAYN